MSKSKLGISTGKGFLEVYKDANGVLKCGDMIIPQRKLVGEYTSSVPVSVQGGSTTTTTIYTDANPIIGRTFEVIINGYYFKFAAGLNTGVSQERRFYVPNPYSIYQPSENDHDTTYPNTFIFSFGTKEIKLKILGLEAGNFSHILIYEIKE